jgi:hypothetical protein
MNIAIRVRERMRGSRFEDLVRASGAAPLLRRFYSRFLKQVRVQDMGEWVHGLASRPLPSDECPSYERVLRAEFLFITSLSPYDIQPRKETNHFWQASPATEDPTNEPSNGSDRVPRMAGLAFSGHSVVIALGNDDYRLTTGGIQVCVGEEQVMLNAAGFDYLYCFPAKWSRSLSRFGDDVQLKVVLNGFDTGVTLPSSRFNELLSLTKRRASATSGEVVLTIHGMLGHNPEAIGDALLNSQLDRAFFWLHDYFTVCPSPSLTYDELSFCGAPSPQTSRCTTCNAGASRHDHMIRMATFFEKVHPTLLSPSTFAQQVLSAAQRSSGLSWPELNVITVPHGEITWTGARSKHDEFRPLTVAFLGLPVPQKGWLLFEEIAMKLKGSQEWNFVHVGAERSSVTTFRHLKQVGAYSGQATATLSDLNVDVLFAYSQWPETFHIASHEAMAAGAAILTSSASGNIYEAASLQGRLIDLGTSEAVLQSFANGTARDSIIRRIRADRRTGAFSFSGLTLGAIRAT